MNLVFATNNKHKLEEIRHALGIQFKISGLSEIGITDEIPEPYDTLEENALQKVKYIYERYHFNCFADDTGLEVSALNGKPGVLSARYAGENCSFDDNINKLLFEMKGVNQRRARFRTILALMEDGQINTFEGIIDGYIAEYRSGFAGFGYDPIFIPEGFSLSFAEMDIVEKNRISHRAKALQKLVNYLNPLSSK
jgi:XTP/dITP diphosphohydrolase